MLRTLVSLPGLGLHSRLAGIGLNFVPERSSHGERGAARSGHPLVGTWMMPGSDGAMIVAFTSDGIVMSAERDQSGLGSWDATGPHEAAGTLVVITQQDGAGIVLAVRAGIVVDASRETATIDLTVTVHTDRGEVLYSQPASLPALRLPTEGPDRTGSPLAGFPLVPERPAG